MGITLAQDYNIHVHVHVYCLDSWGTCNTVTAPSIHVTRMVVIHVCVASRLPRQQRRTMYIGKSALGRVQVQVQGVGYESHYSDAQLQWLIELCYMVGCHANSIHAQHLVYCCIWLVPETATVMSFSQNVPAILLYDSPNTLLTLVMNHNT